MGHGAACNCWERGFDVDGNAGASWKTLLRKLQRDHGCHAAESVAGRIRWAVKSGRVTPESLMQHYRNWLLEVDQAKGSGLLLWSALWRADVGEPQEEESN